MRGILAGSLLLAAGFAARPGVAEATSMLPRPPFVEEVARGFDVTKESEESGDWALRTKHAFGGYDRAGGNFRLAEDRVLTPEERAAVVALARAQRANDPAPFAAALTGPRPWLCDEALAALPHGRVATGYENALRATEAARAVDVAFVVRFLPDLRRLAAAPPPTSNAASVGATPVLATRCLLWLSWHLEGKTLAEALDAAIEGVASTPHWQSVEPLSDFLEARPTTTLTDAQRARLIPVLREKIGTGFVRESQAGAILARLRDAEGLEKVHAAYVRTSFWPHLVALARGGHPKAREDVAAALRTMPTGFTDWALVAAGALRDPTLVPAMLARIAETGAAKDGAAALTEIGTPEAAAALRALSENRWVRRRADAMRVVVEALLKLDPKASGPIRDALPEMALPGRLAALRVLAESEAGGEDLTEPALAAFAALEPGSDPYFEGARALAAASHRARDGRALARLREEVDALSPIAGKDYKTGQRLDVLIEAFSPAGRLPPSIETWLIGMWAAGSPSTRSALAYTLGRAGGPTALAFLRPHAEYGGSGDVREATRTAIGLLERRGG